ncbi:AbrB family transcriptional regulator [Bosea sp. 117]|uniref:AbrB family transcriptional regulator n=1 Tax=Bosea sp. 117 TaxID=1125973 RepID=UPI0012DDE7C6|nr:AbrB family transcriptional regulator [Bosea sp. 117]
MTDSTGDKLAAPLRRDALKSHIADGLRCVMTLAVGGIGGAIASVLHLPLPWLIGAMIACTSLVWVTRAEIWRWVRPLALIVLGLGLGQSFSPPILAAVASALPTVAIAGVLTICMGIAVSRLFARLAGTDLKTGYYCAVPGGVIVMAIQAERAGADVPSVTFTQSIRLVLVVLTIPPILALSGLAQHGSFPANAMPPATHAMALSAMIVAGFFCARLGKLLRFTNPWMIMPCFLAVVFSATDRLPSGVPVELIDAAQVVLGASLGIRLTRDFLLRSWRLLVASAISTLTMSAALAALALVVAWLSGLPAAAVILGMAPGGMPEMSLTARALDAPVALVLGFHLVRVILSNLLIEPIWRIAVRIGLAH